MPTAYDLHFQLINPEELASGANGKLFCFGFSQPIGIAGPQKLLNRWVKTFMESAGSYPLRPTRGTGFSSLIGSNIVQVADLETVIHLYVEDTNQLVRDMDANSRQLSNDERLSTASVRSFVVIPPDGFEATIELTTLSGRRLTALLPSSIFGDPNG